MDVHSVSTANPIVRGSKYFPNKLVLISISENKRITYGELNKRINRLSNALIDLGVRKGDLVATFLLNTPSAVESRLAIAKAGAVCVVLNTRLAPKELIYQVDNADSVMMIYTEELSKVADEIRPQLPRVKTYICEGKALPPDTFNYEELMAKYPDTEPDVEVEGTDGCVIYYTAGTTGLPKGAYRTHSDCFWAAMDPILNTEITSEDVILSYMPYFHHGGWEAVYLPPFIKGATIIQGKAWNPREALESIEREKPTVAYFAPAMTGDMLRLPDFDKYDLSSLRRFMTAGAPFPPEYKFKLWEKVPHLKIHDTLGLSEGGFVGWVSAEVAKDKHMAFGIPSSFVRVRLVDDDGNDVPPGEVGEILVQSPGVFKEYYKEPKKTAGTLVDGWLHTGDVGRADEDGIMYLVDRKKDMVKTGGENVYSAEVENVLSQNPKLAEATIIALPDEKWGERVTAVVALKPGEEATEEELITFCRGSLAGYKCPKQVIFRDSLPRNVMGKIVKRDLRVEYGGKA